MLPLLSYSTSHLVRLAIGSFEQTNQIHSYLYGPYRILINPNRWIEGPPHQKKNTHKIICKVPRWLVQKDYFYLYIYNAPMKVTFTLL